MSQIDFSKITLPLRYEAGKYSDGRAYEGVNEFRPLDLLQADLPQLFPYTGNGNNVPPPERARPRQEVIAANLLRAVQNPHTWEEEWVAFWRDHFSLFGHEQSIGAYLPHWEREVIRAHAFGNFRQFLGAVATHPAMLNFLNNRSSRAGNANENYARELFELHTLGRKAYANQLYARWHDVPGSSKGKPVAYIDEDVYEAARAFTGWAVEDGSWIGSGEHLPKTGRFTYIDAWHDRYQKRVLAQEFSPYASPMDDGKRVLDLCSGHPQTAYHLATKLVHRMVSENPPQSLIQSTSQIWLQHLRSPDQLSHVYNHLISASQALQKKQVSERLQKIRKPQRLISAFAQAVNLPFTLGEGHILWAMDSAGPPAYGWASPAGPSDQLSWYLSSAYLRGRIALIQGLAENWWGTGLWDPFSQLSIKPTYAQFMSRWEVALFGIRRPALSQALLGAWQIVPTEIAHDAGKARRLVGLLACSPSFQTEIVIPIHAQPRMLRA